MADKNKDAATGDAMKPFWPDVCNTTYVATGDADELVKMRDELEDCMKSGGLLWLLDELRLDDTRVDCRGHVSCVAGLDACGRLRWVVRSAWEPCRDLFDAFAARHSGLNPCSSGRYSLRWAFVSRNLDPATIEPDHCVLRAFYEGGGLQWMLTKVGEAKASEIRRL